MSGPPDDGDLSLDDDYSSFYVRIFPFFKKKLNFWIESFL